MDIDSVFGKAMAYVMLSRVQSLDQIYILGKLNPKKITVDQKCLEELERLERISINRNPTPWNAQAPGKSICVMISYSTSLLHVQVPLMLPL